jgi:hypothetical protein
VDQFDRALTRVLMEALRRGLVRQRRGKPRDGDGFLQAPALARDARAGLVVGLAAAVVCVAALARLLRAG